MLNQKQKLIPIVVAIGLFLLLSVVYMSPALEGKKIKQSDVIQHQGMSKELVDFRNETGKEALWTNSMFGGMPAYMISTQFKGNLLKYFHRILMLNNWRPICFVFLYMVGFWLMLLAFKVNPWLSIVGAIAYAFSSYFFIIIEVGHISKVLALGYLPPIIGGIHLAFRGKYLWGLLLTGIALGLQIYVVHLQITYYTFIIVIVYGLCELISAIYQKQIEVYAKALAVLFLAVILAVGCNFSSLWTTYEYGKFSTRSKSDLTADKENKTTGLDKDYATQWSYGVGESFTLLIPNFKGGATYGPLSENSKTFKFLTEAQGRQKAKQYIKQMPTYFGKQPGTSGPVYAGAIIVFFFVLGLFLVENKYRFWLLAVTFISLVLSWGNNIPDFTNFLLDHLPAYNKFRAVSMTLVIAEFAIPLLALLALDRIIKGELSKKVILNALTISFSITTGILLIIIAVAGSFNFEASADKQYLAQGATQFVDALQSDRLSLLRKDTFRSLVYILLAAGIVYLFIKNKMNQTQTIIGLGVLVLFDMWTIDKRYLNNENFVTEKQHKNSIVASEADKYILQDPSKDYRVMNLTADIFNDATTSYFHKSLGGYHGAKMRRYQELIENRIYPELQTMIDSLKASGMQNFNRVMSKMSVLNMLNTRYFIVDPASPPLVNASALGNAWFVDRVEVVKNADEEISKLGTINTRHIALVEAQFETLLQGKKISRDSSAKISLEDYKPNYLMYKSSSNTDQVAVFSEIYYPKGWNVTIDGNPAEYFRANYILRSMVVPSGDHTIEFKFEPRSYFTGEKISLASSLLFIILLLGGIGYEMKKITAREHSRQDN